MTEKKNFYGKHELFKGRQKYEKKNKNFVKKNIDNNGSQPENIENTSKPNIGWLFNKGYYLNLGKNMKIEREKWVFPDQDLFENINRQLITSNLKNYENEIGLSNITYINCHFSLKTTYPGLLIGIGSAHETGLEGEYKLGFYFDHATGLPVVPGSSVKGLLRSAFRHPEYIISLLQDDIGKISEDEVLIIENEIFRAEITNQKDEIIHKSLYERDVFFDTVIEGKQGEFLAEDYVTPHLDPLKNPIPLKFIKVSPEVSFKFQFKLNDYRSMKKEIKKSLFRKIILDLGLGARTNVGYGRFQEV